MGILRAKAHYIYILVIVNEMMSKPLLLIEFIEFLGLGPLQFIFCEIQ